MLKALRSKGGGGRGQISQTKTMAAPTGGWNARDPDAAMGEQFALQMDNFYPSVANVQLRKGCIDWVGGIPGRVRTLMRYGGATSEKLFAAASVGAGTGAIYDVTTQGTVGAPVVTGQTNTKYKYTNYANPGGKWLYCCNGADAPQLYNGTSWQAVTAVSSPIAITGVTTSTLSDVMIWKTRVIFTQANSLSLWYLDVNAVGGTAHELPLSTLFKLGGSIVTVATWTIDGGYGMDDNLVIITNKGEIAVYRGTDPSNANNFMLVGVYPLGAPVGIRPCVKFGGDLLLLTLDGLFPLSAALASTRIDNKMAITDKIMQAVSDSTGNYQGNYGWQVFNYPKNNMLILNVPITNDPVNAITFQYVMNTITGAWCRFIGWNASCFELLNDDMFFGTYGKVCQAWTGTSDSGALISGLAKQAYSYFDQSAQSKKFKMARPIIKSNFPPKITVGMNIDFSDSDPGQTNTYSGSPSGVWDQARWDANVWDGTQIYKTWQSVLGDGYAGSFYIAVSSNVLTFSWSSTDFLFETGSVI